MGLRLKLGLYVGTLVCGVVALSSYFALRTEHRIYLGETRTLGVALMQSFAIPCASALSENDAPLLDNYVAQFSQSAEPLDLEFVAVLDAAGKIIAHTEPRNFGRTLTDRFTQTAIHSDQTQLEQTATHMNVAVPIVGGLRWGTLRASFSLKGVHASIAESRQQFLLIGLAVLILASLAAYLVLSSMVVTPVRRMASMAEAIRKGHFDSRAVVRQGGEVGELALRLNQMAQQLQDHTEELEQLVQQRTGALAETNRQLKEANVELQRLARVDPLTGLYNRRFFMEQLDFEIRRGQRTGHQFALVLLDLDNFKQYNDTYGHPAGDELLQRLSILLELNLRATDVLARYGGEEFIILLLDTKPPEGYATAKKIQEAVATQPFPREGELPEGKITVSAGVSFYPPDSRDGQLLIEYADRALYESKARGKNRVTRWSDIAAANAGRS